MRDGGVSGSTLSMPKTLVTKALAMAIETRSPKPDTIIHSDHGTVFTSWVFTQRAKDSGLLPRVGAAGSCYDNSMIDSF